MTTFLPIRGKLSPEAARQDATFLASCAEANLSLDIAKVERQLAQVRERIASLKRELPLAPAADDDRVRQLEAKLERQAAQLAAHESAGNDGMVTQLTHAMQQTQKMLDELRLKLGATPAGQVREKLRELRAEEDKLDRELFALNEQYDELARRHDARCAAEDEAARLAAAREAALEAIIAGELPCE